MPDVLESAFDYLDRGWPVIPAIGKQPAVSWAAYQNEAPSTVQVRNWFAGGQGYNVAVITGRYAGLVVVDCDSDEDARWWRSRFAVTPLVVATGRGGAHFYYRYPSYETVRNRARLFGRKLDLRADGGLVIAPPSIHPETGRAYQWKYGFDCPYEDVPEFDVGWVASHERMAPVRLLSHGLSKATIRDGLAYICRINAISGNGGHNATYRAACKLRDSGLTAAEALEALALWNETNASPPWTAKELAHKVDDAYENM